VPGFVQPVVFQCGGIQRCTNYRNYLDSTQPHHLYTPRHYQHHHSRCYYKHPRCYHHHPHLICPSRYFVGGGAQDQHQSPVWCDQQIDLQGLCLW
jgi:hypothetical protein